MSTLKQPLIGGSFFSTYIQTKKCFGINYISYTYYTDNKLLPNCEASVVSEAFLKHLFYLSLFNRKPFFTAYKKDNNK